jgi:hypothetical protein
LLEEIFCQGEYLQIFAGQRFHTHKNGSQSRKLLQFFMNQGSIKIEQLQVSNLIVNYCLYLLSKEIEANSSLGEIQFENFSLMELPRDLSCVRRSGLLGILLVLLYVGPIPRSVNERVGELLCGLRRFSNNSKDSNE